MQKSYQFTANDADIILRTPESNVFRVHKNILCVASPVFRDMLQVSQSSSESITGVEYDLPVVDVHDSAQDLDTLLRMIYPVAFPAIIDLDALSRTFVILDKYQTEGLQERLRLFLISPTFLTADPMRVYSIACRWGFEAEAAIAAPHAAAVGFSGFTCMDDMRYISGLDYHRVVLLAQELRETARGKILTNPTTCRSCRSSFYDNFRHKLVERLLVGNDMFRDLGSCMEVCFEMATETENERGGGNCVGGSGRSHVDQFVISLAKSLQSIPSRQGKTA